MISIGLSFVKRYHLTLIVLGGGQDRPCDAKFIEMGPCLHNNSTALLKQISLFTTIKSAKLQIPKVSTELTFDQ